jgi:hypothetical protein
MLRQTFATTAERASSHHGNIGDAQVARLTESLVRECEVRKECDGGEIAEERVICFVEKRKTPCEGKGGVGSGVSGGFAEGRTHEPLIPITLINKRAMRNWKRVMNNGARKAVRTSLFRKVSERETTK